MSSVLDRDALEQSPLADLHLIANELGVDGFRRLRKADLVDAIIATPVRRGADGDATPTPTPRTRPSRPPRPRAAPKPRTPRERARRRRPGGRGRGGGRGRDEAEEDGATDEDAPPARAAGAAAAAGRGRARGGRDGGREPRARDRDRGDRDRGDRDRGAEDRVAEGVVELLGNGSAFIRLGPTARRPTTTSTSPPRRSSAASSSPATAIAGPVRAPRRSERFPSLVRVDTINGRPADEVAEGTKFEDLPAAWPTERLALGSEDVTLKAVEWLTPFGKGSRVLICGGPRAGKTRAGARHRRARSPGREGLELLVVLAGVRPEEAGDWAEPAPVAAVVVRRLARRAGPGRRAGGRAGPPRRGPRRRRRRRRSTRSSTLPPHARPPRAGRGAQHRRRRLAHGHRAPRRRRSAARRRSIALDAQLTALRRFPALDLPGSGTLRADALVGRGGRRGDRQGARGGGGASGPAAPRPRRRSAAGVGDPAPVGLGRELDRLVVALGLDVAEGVRRARRRRRRARPP